MSTIEESVNVRLQEIYRDLAAKRVEEAWDTCSELGWEKVSRFHPIANAMFWLASSKKIHREMIYAYASMDAHAEKYKEANPKGSRPSHVVPLVSYFADDCVVRLDTFRDKAALAMMSLYEPVDVRKHVPDYPNVLKFFRGYQETGASKEFWLKEIIRALSTLDGGPWALIEKLRHAKIHMLESRIEIYGIEPHHEERYLTKVENEADFAKLKAEIVDIYGTGELAQIVLAGCAVGDAFYLEGAGRGFGYDEVEASCRECIKISSEAFASCLRIAEAEFGQIK